MSWNPEIKGFPLRDPKYERAFSEARSDGEFVQASLARLACCDQLAPLDMQPSEDGHR